MTGYPIELDLAGKHAVVVGGGQVALRRTKALVEAGANVTVIAPVIAQEFSTLGVTVVPRPYRDGDLAGAWLAHAATDDPEVNAAVATAANQARIWCVRADDATATAARMPAVTRHGDVTVAVTACGDPRRSQRLRSAISLALAQGTLPVRRQRRRDLTSVPDRGRAPTSPPSQSRGQAGGVALVGGGPGDPGLMTVLGRRLLAEADVVVADRLGPRDVLAELDPDVEIIEAGKAPGAHRLTQDQINELIVERARAGYRVVRLKGGDPFVFGRGGEEALACVAAGVPVTVVPGVTSAIAVPAYAGIPVTHRGITQDFAVVSAHLDPSQPGATVDWDALANGPGTLVLLMAVAHLEQIGTELIKRGRDAATPVAVIQDGTTENQRVLVSTLDHVARDAAAESIRSPAVIVVGEVVRLRDQLASPLPAREAGAAA
ncbi:MAG TPA: uroporphyrinogen-III C-methyltransferase [Streptosporangiaceae bacterium]|nr:uroporphyrinogen-III C-methyltransferase [Streptosporangiaceae bacterium]